MKKEVKRIVILSLVINIILTIIKLIGGYAGNTTSLVSDGYNSLADILISLLLIITLTISGKKPDKDHPYGHEKYEGVISFVLGFFLLLTASFIIFEGITNLVSYDSNSEYIKPANYTLVIAGISIILKAFIYSINIIGYKKYDQVCLKAESYNHLSDIFATAASIIGIILAIRGYIYIDYIASIIIGLMIIKNGVEVIKESISYLVDEAPKKEYMNQIKNTILEVDGVLSIEVLKARKHVNKVYVDVEIIVDNKLSLVEAHDIAENVHHTIESNYPDVIHCMVHFSPKIKKT